MDNLPKDLTKRLAELALQIFFQQAEEPQQERLRPLLAQALRQGLRVMTGDEARKAVAALEAAAENHNPRSPPVTGQMLRIVGTAGAVDWAREHHPQLRQLGAAGLR